MRDLDLIKIGRVISDFLLYVENLVSNNVFRIVYICFGGGLEMKRSVFGV